MYIPIPPHQCFSNSKTLQRRFMNLSQLSNSPKFRAVSTGSDLWPWFVLQQVHPRMLKQSCSSSSSCPAALAIQQLHSWLPTHSITPENTSTLPTFVPSRTDPMLYARASAQNNSRQGATSQSCAPHSVQEYNSLAFLAGVNQQESFQGKRSHKELCRFTWAEVVPCYFSLPPGC